MFLIKTSNKKVGVLDDPFLPLQLSGWWFLTFTATEIKEKVHYLTGVQFLYDTINPDQIDIPQFVFDHDITVSSFSDLLTQVTFRKK